MKKIFKKIFSPKNWKRWLVVFFTFSFAIIGITLGSNLYISKNVNKSIEYGGGAEVLVQVKNLEGKPASEKTVERVDEAIYNRLTGGTGLNGTSVSIEGEGRIRVSRNGISTNEQINNFTKEVVNKPYLTVTDIDNKPLFWDGKFIENGSLDNGDEVNWAAPFKEGGASAQPSPNNPSGNEVLIKLKDKEGQLEWAKATDYISKQYGKNVILIWLNLKELIKKAETEFPVEWEKAGKNPYKFIHVNEETEEKDLGDNKKLKPLLKKEQFDASKYLISQASVQSALSGESFVIQGNFSSSEAKQLALNINYGTDSYKLELLSSSFVSQELGNSAFNSALIAGIIAISLIAIFMIVNYGLLGALSTISLSLYVFLTLLLFTIMRGEYSPTTIAALIIGIGMSVDANIISFEVLKKDIYLYGSNPIKANAKSQKTSFSTILDSNITTLLVAWVLFYFGTKDVKGFAITLILSIVFTLFIMLFFTKIMSNLLVKTGVFDKRLWLLGIRKKYVEKYQNKYVSILEKPNYVKATKWTTFVPVAILVLGIIIYIIFASIGASMASGLNSSIEFNGGTNLLIESEVKDHSLITLDKAKEIISFLESKGIQNKNGEIIYQQLNQEGTLYNVVVKTQQDITNILSTLNQELTSKFNNIKLTTYSISSQEAKNLVINAITAISVALVAVILYTLVRLKWTFSIAAIISLLHDVIIVFALFIIFRIEFSPIFVAAILSVIGYSINDTIVVFDRIKEIIKEMPYHEIYEKKAIKEIVNKAIRETMKRSIFTSLTTLTTVMVLMSFQNATDIKFNLALLFGIICGTYSSLFIASNIWVYLEVFRNKRVEKRIKKGYWNTQKIKEQTFIGINDFQK